MSQLKTKLAMRVMLMFPLMLPCMAQAAEWFPCGNLGGLSNCQLQAYPGLKYEYGIVWNSPTPLPVVCTGWNVGWRIYNKDPFFVFSDNPQAGMKWGGFMFYTETNSTADDVCHSGTWRYGYWTLGTNNAVTLSWDGGCINPPLYCRLR